MVTHSLQAKFIWPVSALVVVTTLILVAIIAMSNSHSIEQSAKSKSVETLASVGQILAVTDAITMERVKGSMNLLMERGRSLGDVRQGSVIAINGQRVPDLLLGGRPQALDFHLVDGVTSTQGGTATLFSRQGDNFVRISTNVKQNGQRAIGTLLNPHGQAIGAIRAGRAFYGQVDILGTPFLTGYEPMYDRQHNVIGVWYVGYPVGMQAVQESIAKSRILHKGFIVLMDDKGKIRFHSDNVTSALAQSVVNGSMQKWGFTRAVFKPWGFIMVAAYPKDEVRDMVRREILTVAVAGLMIGSILVGLLIWLARSLVITPLQEAVFVAQAIANGNLTDPILTERKDEIGVLLQSLNHMQASLRQMIEKMTSHAQSIDQLKDAAIQHLRRQDQLKSGFLSSVSHELRTPLTSIRGFAHLVEREFSRSFAMLAGDNAQLNKKAGRILENLTIILKESDRLTRLINDVLDLAKIEAGRVDWRDKTVQVDVLVRDAVNAAQGVFSHKPDIELKVDIQNGLPPIVGDSDRLLQVLVNLLNNAAKFTDKGCVTVKVFLNEQPMIQIDISDTGIGFLPEESESIFDKFQQARQGDTLVDHPKGTGLGLAIAREIVERHGGTIHAQSQLGEGSVFTVLLPCSPDPVEPVPDIAPPHAALTHEYHNKANEVTGLTCLTGHETKPRILVVDDDEGVRNYLTQLLQDQGYEVMVAADGQAALASAREFLPDIVTMDLSMPIMDGRTAIAHLRADPATRHIPIMVLSALPDMDSAGGTLAMGKPLNEGVFLKNLELLLGRVAVADQKQMRFVILYDTQRENAMKPGGFTAHCELDYCSLDELENHIQSNIQDILLIPADLLDKIDLNRLHASCAVKVMIVPYQQATPHPQ